MIPGLRGNVSNASLIGLPLIVFGGAALRWISLGESLWLDELHTSWVVSGSWSEIASRARLGNNGPLYFYCVRGILLIVGANEWGLRSLSFFSGLGLIVGTYFVALRWQCTPAIALLAAALVALDRQAVFYATEARTYGLVQLFALVHLAVFVQLLINKPTKQAWALWTTTGALLIHLHCTASLLYIGEVSAFFLLRAMRTKPAIRPALLFAGVAVAGLLALPTVGLVQQLAERRQNWALFVRQTNFTNVLTVFPLHVYVLLPACAAVGWYFWRRRNDTVEQEDSRRARIQTIALVTCVAWLVAPLLIAWWLTHMDLARLFFRRYLIASSVSLAFVTSLTVSRLLLSTRSAFVVAVLVLGAALSHASIARRGEDWRGAIGWLNVNTPSRAPLLLCSGLIETNSLYNSSRVLERSYCAFPVRALYRLDPAREIVLVPTTDSFRMPEEALRSLSEQGAWLLVRGPQRVLDVKRRVKEACPGMIHFGEERVFGRLVVVSLFTAGRGPDQMGVPPPPR